MPLLQNLLAIVAASTIVTPAIAVKSTCPPLGPVLPAPKAPSKGDAMKKTIKALEAGLDEKTSSLLEASALSVGVKSIHESEQLFSYHFTPPKMGDLGTDKIDENTIYRVGSISKMMPALAVLQCKDINIDDSVLEYIPELADATVDDEINANLWEDITVRSLASHLSGLSNDMPTDLGVFPSPAWLELGLPEIPKGEGPTCSGLEPTEPCNKKDLIKGMASRPPVFLPQSSTPVYSNIAYAILGMVVESATGQKFDDYVKSKIFDVAGMESTSFNGFIEGSEDEVFVPATGDPTWNGTLGVFEASGGMFSNTVDLIAFAEAIQKNKLLSGMKTREWMKPETHTSSLGFSVGQVWEILRSDNLTTDGRVIDVYTKSGDLGNYHALLGIVPDYDVSVVVITAGPEVSGDPHARSRFFSAVIEAIVPALEDAGRSEAEAYEGTYTEESSNSTLVLSSDDGPGLYIEEFTVRGVDVLAHMPIYNVNSLEQDIPPPEKLPEVTARMYPTKRTGKGKGKDTIETAWRAFWDAMPDKDLKQLESDLFWVDGTCQSWMAADRSAYNYLSLTDFAMVEGSEGKIEAVKNAAFNVTLTKVSGSTGDSDDEEGGSSRGSDGDDSGSSSPVAEGAAGKATISSFIFLTVPVLMALQWI